MDGQILYIVLVDWDQCGHPNFQIDKIYRSRYQAEEYIKKFQMSKMAKILEVEIED